MAGNRKTDPVVFGYYLIASMDILNQKEGLSKFKGLPTTEEEKKSFFQSIRETFGVVDGFRTTFENFFSENIKGNAAAEALPKVLRIKENTMMERHSYRLT